MGWPDAAHRVLRNAAIEEWEAAGRPPSGQRPGEGTIVGRYSVAGQLIDVRKYGVDPPMASFEGDIEQTALYCGQSCSLVNDIRPAGEIVQEMAREATSRARTETRVDDHQSEHPAQRRRHTVLDQPVRRRRDPLTHSDGLSARMDGTPLDLITSDNIG